MMAVTKLKAYHSDTALQNTMNYIIDKEKTKGDEIVGGINVSENGYFVLSIPYEEKGFTIFVDDKLTEYEKINDTFIGLPINEGYHDIKIIYTSPYLFEGMIVSICGYMIFLPIIGRLLIWQRNLPLKTNT